MFAPLPFALHATTGCPPHAELALSLACAFEDLDAMAVDGDLETLARRLPPPASSHPLAELKSLARVGPCGETTDDVGTEGLLLHTVLSARTPHPPRAGSTSRCAPRSCACASRSTRTESAWPVAGSNEYEPG
jgi:hypothetical protein